MPRCSSAPLSADDAPKKGKKGKRAPQAGAQLKKQLAKAELSEEQQKKIDDLVGEFAAKLAEARKQVGDAQKAVSAARKKAAEEGKKGKDLRAAIDAVELTDEQKKGLAAQRELNAGLRKAVLGVLTAEQIEKAGLKRAGGAKKGNKKKAPKKEAAEN